MSSINVGGELLLQTKSIPPQPLWHLFESLWQPLFGLPAEDFQFEHGKTPMSTLTETSAVLISYYIIILGGRELMRKQPALDLNGLFKFHNLSLTIISGTLLALFMEQLGPSLYRHGLYENICGSPGWTKPLVSLYHLNYITKYIELIDTLFLVVRKKPLTFLHTYHHGATALLCYTQLVGHTPVSWVPITLNLAVHVVMYWYYFQASRGIRVWWKEWITRLQILQFVIDLAFVYFATYDYAASTYLPKLPHVGTCKGEEFAAFTGCAILSSYLVLFLSFYAATYKKGKGSGSKSKMEQGQASTGKTDASKPPLEATAKKAAETEVASPGQAKEGVKIAANKTEEGIEAAAGKLEKEAEKTAHTVLD